LLEVASVDDCEPNPRPGETAVGFFIWWGWITSGVFGFDFEFGGFS